MNPTPSPSLPAASAEPIRALLPEVRALIDAAAQGTWPGLADQIRCQMTDHPLPFPLVVPLATCLLAGGAREQAITVAGACGLLALATRWFDDVQDRDRDGALWSQLGSVRASNMAAACFALSVQLLARDPAMPRVVVSSFVEGALVLARGQDRDLAGCARSAEDYWTLMREKTGAALALAARAGALAGRAEPAIAEPLGRYGEHLGVLIQILDDLDGCFHPAGMGDLQAGKVTLPVLFGLTVDHSRRAALRALVAEGRLGQERAQALEILDSIETREFLVWAASEEHRQALEHLSRTSVPPHPRRDAALRALESFAHALMSDVDELLSRPPSA
ncbi:MAG TPA: polyprenyl synthetase family protein [Haliangium sp.]|nr:polyprenyl synthetase family protein [Haliangium sp.]